MLIDEHTPPWSGPSVPNRAQPWASFRVPWAQRCADCRSRPATRIQYLGRLGHGRRAYAVCQACYQRTRRVVLPMTTLTRQNRRLRWAVRCVLHRRPATRLSVDDVTGLLRGECADCVQRSHVASEWIRAFVMRKRLVRRNLQGDVRKQLLAWVWETEQDRGDRTWRYVPSSAGPPRAS